MNVISTTTSEGTAKIKTLDEKSKEIDKIVTTIKGISEQTNLLALNAAIEAARAGDAGRGFAVVADEVRKLAEESKDASGQISELISSIQGEISLAVTSMDTNTDQVKEGVGAVQKALKAFDDIPIHVDEVNKSLLGMSSVAEENAAVTEEVSASIVEVSSAIQEVASSAESLSRSADELQMLTSKFTT